MLESALAGAGALLGLAAVAVVLAARRRSRAATLVFCVATSVLAAGLVVARHSPRFVRWRGLGIPEARDNPEVVRANDALRQLENPLARIDDPTNAVIRWRLLPPFVAHELGLPPRAYLGLPHLGCLAALAYVAALLRRETASARVAFLGTVLAAETSWFFVSSGWLAYFDSWYVLGLLAASFGRSARTVAVASLLTPWIDERFVVAVPLILAVRGFEPALGWVLPYVLVRLAALRGDALAHAHLESHLDPRRLAAVPADRWVRGLWHGLRALWPFALAASPRRLLVLGGAAFAILVSLALAQDVSRSASIVLPAALLGLARVAQTRPRARTRALLLFACAVDLALPARHVVTTYEMRIPSVPHQLEAWRAPPPPVDPAWHVARADQLVASGRLADARTSLDTALALDPGHGPALLARGLLRERSGDVTGARADLTAGLSAESVRDRCRRELERLGAR